MGKYKEVTKELIQLVQEKKSGKEISKILNLDYSTVHAKLRKLGISLPNYHNSLKFDNTVFETIDSEEKAYWLGFLYADGYISATVNTVELSLKGSDIEHLKKYREFVKGHAEVKLSTISCNGKDFTRCRYSLTDKHYKETLVHLGCIPRKSLNLKFPSLDIFSYPNLIYPFIRGYVDGDGCLTFSKSGRLVLQILGTKEFLSGIQKIFPQFHIYKKDKRSNVYAMSCACTPADEVAKKLYSDATIFLKRKYDRFCRAVQK